MPALSRVEGPFRGYSFLLCHQDAKTLKLSYIFQLSFFFAPLCLRGYFFLFGVEISGLTGHIISQVEKDPLFKNCEKYAETTVFQSKKCSF